MLNVSITLKSGIEVELTEIRNISTMNKDVYFIANKGSKTKSFAEKDISSIICMPTFTYTEPSDKMIDRAKEIVNGKNSSASNML